MSLTCVTTGKPKGYRTPEFAITFRTISEHLFWGFVEKQTRYSKYQIAEPEKALLDWSYLTLQSGLTPHLDEIELQVLDKQKLVKYADKYPNTVRNALTSSLAFEYFAAKKNGDKSEFSPDDATECETRMFVPVQGVLHL